MFIYENRASVILYNILNSFQKTNKKFLIPLNSCSVVPFTFLKAQINFEFVDISNSTLCMDEELILDLLSNNSDEYLGVLFIKSFGVNEDFNHFFKKIKEIDPNFFIIDDRCLSIPNLDFSLNETYADLTLFSTGESKYIEIGGAFAYLQSTISYQKYKLIYNLSDYTELSKNLNGFVSGEKDFFTYQNSNWLGDETLPYSVVEEYKEEVQSQLKRVTLHKDSINKIYTNELPVDIQYDKKYQVWRFNLNIDNKDKVLKNIFASNLFAGSHYIPLDKVFTDIVVHRKIYHSNAELLYTKNINLFNNFDFSEKMAFDLTKIIKKSI